ncbi:hypothetical protein V8E51_003161 [Hyaloscypha variabilis]
MKLFILSFLYFVSSTLAIPAPAPEPLPSPTSPNILQASFELSPSFDRDQCCKVFRQLWGTYFGGPRHCDGACVCDWLGTNIANASYGTPCAGANSDTPDNNWSWCTDHCVPSYSITLSLPLPPWTSTSWPPLTTAPNPTSAGTRSAMATPFDTLISKGNGIIPGVEATKTGRLGSIVTKAPVVIERQTLDFGTGSAVWETTLGFEVGGPGETVTIPGIVTLTFGG